MQEEEEDLHGRRSKVDRPPVRVAARVCCDTTRRATRVTCGYAKRNIHNARKRANLIYSLMLYNIDYVNLIVFPWRAFEDSPCRL